MTVPDEAPAHLRSEHLALGTLRGTGAAAEVLVWADGDFEKQLHLTAPLPAAVVEHGRVLYGAG